MKEQCPEPTLPFRAMAEFILAIGIGTALERAADPAALADEELMVMLPRALGLPDIKRSDGRANAPSNTRRASQAGGIGKAHDCDIYDDGDDRLGAVPCRGPSRAACSGPRACSAAEWSAHQLEAAQRHGLRRLSRTPPSTRPFTADVWPVPKWIESIPSYWRACR